MAGIGGMTGLPGAGGGPGTAPAAPLAPMPALPGLTSPTQGMPQAPGLFQQFTQAVDPRAIQEQQAMAAQQQAQMAQAQSDQQDIALKHMSMLTRMARNNPQFQQDPQFKLSIQQLAGKAGIPTQGLFNPDGTVNLDSIPGSGGLSDFTKTELSEAMSLNEAQRRVAYPGQAESFYKADQNFTPSEQNNMLTQVRTLLQSALTSGDTAAIESFMRLAGPKMRAMHIDPEQELKSMRQNPGAFMSPLLVGKLDEMDKVGGLAVARTAFQNEMTAEAPFRLEQALKNQENQNVNRTAQTQIAETNAATRAQTALNSANRYIEQRPQREATLEKTKEEIVKLRASNNNPLVKIGANSQYALLVAQDKNIEAEIRGYKDTLNALGGSPAGIKKLRQMINPVDEQGNPVPSVIPDPSNPGKMISNPAGGIVAKIQSLQDELENNRKIEAAAFSALQNSAGNAQTNASGHSTVITGPPPGNAVATDKKGNKVWFVNGKYIYADQTEYKP